MWKSLKKKRTIVATEVPGEQIPRNNNCISKLWRKSKHTFHVQRFFPKNRTIYEIM